MSSLVFHIAIPKTSNVRRTLSFDLLTDKFSKQVFIIRRALCQRIDGTRFTNFNGWIPLKYWLDHNSTYYRSLSKPAMSSLVFHIAIQKKPPI